MLRELAVLFGFACAALSSTGAGASELPPLSCRTVRAPGATCVWAPGATCVWAPGATCTWEEGGTPTACAPLSGARIELRTAGTYRGSYNNASASSGVAYDLKTQRLFVANGATQNIEVVKSGRRSDRR